ncbi:hypothetical protein V8F20_001348 [Naviculisporaceae sp. PSN 640]
MEFLGFVPERNCGRGTITIIWNCVSTLFLAIWVSSHPQPLKPSERGSWLYRKKVQDSLLYLFFPEAGAYIALEACFRSSKLHREMRQISGWEGFSLQQAFLVNGIKGLYQKLESSIIQGANFVKFAQSGRLDPNDFPTDDEIDDRNKSSAVLKAISLSQTLWFMVNMASRLKAGYQISPLEDLTVAHAFCGFIMFVAWFQCPQDVHRPFYVPFKDEVSPTPREYALSAKGYHNLSGRTRFVIVVVLFGIFTSIHLAAWNYPFATVAEAQIWRACSIMTFVLGLALFIALVYDDEIKESLGVDMSWSIVSSLLLYGIIRIAILVVALISFRRAPAGIYDKPTWSAYWPHVG